MLRGYGDLYEEVGPGAVEKGGQVLGQIELGHEDDGYAGRRRPGDGLRPCGVVCGDGVDHEIAQLSPPPFWCALKTNG